MYKAWKAVANKTVVIIAKKAHFTQLVFTV